MPDLPTVAFGDIEITRLIGGGNPLCAYSHNVEQMTRDMAGYFTAERVVEYLHRCQAAGINTLQARGDFHRVLHWRELFRREGGRLHWIAQTASEMFDVFENIRVMAAAGAEAIYHHGSRTDKLWQAGRIDEVRDYLKAMRDAGVRVGLATHIPEVIDHVEEAGWDLDFYMTCVYNLSRTPRESALVDPQAAKQEEKFLPEDPPRMYERVRATDRQCLAFKILGAARRCATQEDVRAAFREAFANIKPTDAVVVGMFPKYVDQIALNVQYTIEACEELTAISSSRTGSPRSR